MKKIVISSFILTALSLTSAHADGGMFYQGSEESGPRMRSRSS